MAWQPGKPIKSAQHEADWQEWRRRTKAEGQRYQRSLYRRFEDACRLRGRRRARTREARIWLCVNVDTRSGRERCPGLIQKGGE